MSRPASQSCRSNQAATWSPSGGCTCWRRSSTRTTGSSCPPRRSDTMPKPTASTLCASNQSSQSAIRCGSAASPTSVSHRLTYAIGSATSRWITQASSPVPANQPATRSPQSSPATCTQFARYCMVPPSVSRPGRGGGQLGADRVADPAGVAVDVRGRARDRPRTVGCSPPGRTARPATGATRSPRQQLPVLAVERGGGGGEAQRPRETSVAVTEPGVGGQVQRLHAAAGAQVQRGVDRPADGRADQRRGGAADAEDVVGVQRLARVGRWPARRRAPTSRRRTAPGRPPGRRPSPYRSTRPAASASASGSGASAAATAASGSVCPQTNTRISVASGSVSVVARSAARKSLRATAAVACGPSRAAMPADVKPAPVSASRSWSTPAGESSGCTRPR